MTDPVPYEPAENIPPILVPQDFDPNPLLLREVKYYPAVPGDPPQESGVEFRATVLDYNIDDVLQVRVVVNESETSGGLAQEITVPPTGEREREISIPLPAGTGYLATQPCSKVILAVSDRGWDTGPPFYLPAKDRTSGDPLTVVALVQWWVWVKTTADTPDGPPVTACGGR